MKKKLTVPPWNSGLYTCIASRHCARWPFSRLWTLSPWPFSPGIGRRLFAEDQLQGVKTGKHQPPMMGCAYRWGVTLFFEWRGGTETFRPFLKSVIAPAPFPLWSTGAIRAAGLSTPSALLFPLAFCFLLSSFGPSSGFAFGILHFLFMNCLSNSLKITRGIIILFLFQLWFYMVYLLIFTKLSAQFFSRTRRATRRPCRAELCSFTEAFFLSVTIALHTVDRHRVHYSATRPPFKFNRFIKPKAWTAPEKKKNNRRASH